MSVTDQVRLMEAELLTLRERQADVDRIVADEVRRAYRRGYTAGWATGRAGKARDTAPERHARTHVRRVLARAAA